MLGESKVDRLTMRAAFMTWNADSSKVIQGTEVADISTELINSARMIPSRASAMLLRRVYFLAFVQVAEGELGLLIYFVLRCSKNVAASSVFSSYIIKMYRKYLLLCLLVI